MPNWCAFEMKVVGTYDKLLKFHKLYDLDGETRFYLVQDMYRKRMVPRVCDHTEEWLYYGECAWSVLNSMLEPDYDFDMSNDTDCPNLEDASQKFDLTFEVFSQEPEEGFMEHYVIRNGNREIDEVKNYLEFWWDQQDYPSFKSYKTAFKLPKQLHESDFVDGFASIGGLKVKWTI